MTARSLGRGGGGISVRRPRGYYEDTAIRAAVMELRTLPGPKIPSPGNLTSNHYTSTNNSCITEAGTQNTNSSIPGVPKRRTLVGGALESDGEDELAK
ncbi:MAG: hypothetical protein Q9177_002994 [Variospora cf. flavescens]